MVETLGLFGLFLGCLLSATIIPFASEALLSGALVLGYGKIECLIAATLGNSLGSIINYGLGYLCKWEWMEKYLHVKKEKIEHFHKKIEKYGVFAALFAFLPIVGDLISISLGFMKARPYVCFLLFFIGKLIRYCIILEIFNFIF